jgi:hypothetical protein
MKEFYVSAKFQMKLPDGVAGVAGGVIMPSGVALHTIERRDLAKKYPHLVRRLLDPQMYLLGLNPATSRKACANLASYPWFPIGLRVPYDSAKHKTQAEWKEALKAKIHKTWSGTLPSKDAEINDAIRLCLEVQKRLGVEAFILPAPLTSDINSSFDVELDWMERGLALAKQLAPEVPVYASIALSDTTVRGPDPWSNALLATILDQVSARGITRAYLVLEQANEDGYYCTHPNTVGALLRLCNGLKHGGLTRVLLAFCGTAGLIGLAAGADAWTSGWYRGERRLKLADFEDQEGRANPAYYSHPMGGEFHLERDLDSAVKKGYLPRLRDDTSASAGLLTALAAHQSSNAVPEWRHRQSNVAASIEHFLLACVRETQSLATLAQPQAEAATKAWLDGAANLAADLYSIGSFNGRTSVNHQAGWLKAFEGYEKNRL